MPEEEVIITTGAGESQAPGEDDSGGAASRPLRKIILSVALGAAVILLGVVVYFIIQKLWLAKPSLTEPTDSEVTTVASSTPVLPGLDDPSVIETEVATSTLNSLEVEYISFADFYKAPASDLTVNLKDYALPLDIKIDVMNYYDISRKLNLDPYLASLSSQGFAVIDNPWATAADFSSLYDNLDSKQIPFLVTSDFLIHYHQNLFKKVFKDIEENVFYDNLWDINKDLYQAAKSRYEARLALIGNVNDPILEAERLETAYFAVALELLKPTTGQLAPKGSVGDGLFAASEADKFYFVVPPYLRDDVVTEVGLIRSGRAVRAKSPVLLYSRNYTEFSVPADYRQNAKLNNFYLTTEWLNSVFPLNFQSDQCSDCLLDRTDWRINLTAASLIAQDFAAHPELKSRWARIYKIMSFFRGLREDLNYIHYRDSLSELFGEDFKSEELFASDNDEALQNLGRLRDSLLEHSWPEISGAIDKTNEPQKIGFKLLADSYWPNEYLFKRLTNPAVSAYLGTTTAISNITFCGDTDEAYRCGGFAFDPINLVYPIAGNSYFTENVNYLNYDTQSSALRTELAELETWQANNYWATLNLLGAFLTADKQNQPLFARSQAWRDRILKTAAGAWINFQLPLQKFSFGGDSAPDQSLSFSRDLENSYVEPNMPLIDEILARNNMLLGMLNALQLDLEVRLAVSDIRNFSLRLEGLRAITLKELNGEELTADDNELIADFIRELDVTTTSQDQQLTIDMPVGKDLQLDLSKYKLLVLVHQEGDNKVFSVGPVWDYRESR